jgi:hypothetical protein
MQGGPEIFCEVYVPRMLTVCNLSDFFSNCSLCFTEHYSAVVQAATHIANAHKYKGIRVKIKGLYGKKSDIQTNIFTKHIQITWLLKGSVAFINVQRDIFRFSHLPAIKNPSISLKTPL